MILEATESSRRRSALGLHYGYVVLGVSVLVVTGALGFGRFAYTLILPSMQEGLRLSNAQMGLIASGNFLGYTLAALVVGVLAARLGPRLVVTVGLVLVGGTMLATGLVQGFAAAVVARTLTGIGSAGGNVSVLSLVTPWVARPRRGMASGMLVAGSGVGLLLAGQIVPRVIAASGDGGWRASWYVLGAAVLASAVLSGLLLRNHPRDSGLAPLWSELESEGPRSTPAPIASSSHGSRVDGAADGSAAGLSAVVRLGVIWRMGIVFAAFGFTYLTYGTFYAAHLMRHGVGAVEAGNLWGVVGVLSLGGTILWGGCSDRLGRRATLVIVYLIQAASLALLAADSSYPVIVLSSVLYGLAGWSIPAIMAAAVGDVVAEPLVPPAMGLLILLLGIGQILGPGVAGVIADAAGSFAPAFALAAGVAVLGALGSLTLRRAADG